MTWALAGSLQTAASSSANLTGREMVDAGLALAAAVFGSGWILTLVRSRTARTDRRRAAVVAAVAQTREHAKTLRHAYRLSALQRLGQNDDPELDRLADEVEAAASATMCTTVLKCSREWVLIAQLHVVGDIEMSIGREQEAFERLSEALMKEDQRHH